MRLRLQQRLQWWRSDLAGKGHIAARYHRQRRERGYPRETGRLKKRHATFDMKRSEFGTAGFSHACIDVLAVDVRLVLTCTIANKDKPNACAVLARHRALACIYAP